jgi:cell division protein FtsL
MYVVLLSIVSVVLISIEKISEKKLDLEITDLKQECDKIKNENRELKAEISKSFAIQNFNEVAETNKYFKPKETDIIYLQND